MTSKKLNKKGIELSINFIVVLILSIVVFGFGLSFLQKITSAASKMELPSDEKFYLESCLNEGNQVCLGTNRKEGKVKDTMIFGFGISNSIGEQTFYVHNEFKRAVLDNGDSFTEAGSNKIPGSINLVKEYDIKNNENQDVLLSYGVPQGTKSGEYVFDVYVCVDGTPENTRDPCSDSAGKVYGGLHKVYIDVI